MCNFALIKTILLCKYLCVTEIRIKETEGKTKESDNKYEDKD